MKKKTLRQFSRKQIFEIAVTYSTGTYTYHDFLKQYPECSQHQFYTILHLSVDKAIVSEQIARKIQNVAVVSSMQKAEDNNADIYTVEAIRRRVYNSWERRIRAMQYFCFSKNEAKKLVDSYSKSSLSKKEFCSQNCINPVLFDRTVIEAVILNWVNDECFDRLYSKALATNNTNSVEHLFMQLSKRRNEVKEMSKKDSII